MQVFFSPSSKYCSALDVVRDDGLGAYSGKTLEQFALDYPDVSIVDDEVSVAHDRKQRITEPKEITKDQFWYWLECLPPCKWKRLGSTEAFHVSERITHDIVTWCVRIGERYFSLDNTDTLNPEQAVNLVANKFFPTEY